MKRLWIGTKYLCYLKIIININNKLNKNSLSGSLLSFCYTYMKGVFMNKIEKIDSESKFPEEHSDAVNALQKESLVKTFRNKIDHKDTEKEALLQTQDSSTSKR
jgi:alpha-amylase/alpha-mannosidase (GH57 family)